MSILTASERAAMTADVEAIIRSGGETCDLLRPVRADLDSFAGSHESSEAVIASAIPCESQALKPEHIHAAGHDLVLHVLPGAGVAEGDFVVLNGQRYRVADVVPHNAFGATTHHELHLVRVQQHPGGF